jgi:uncharacterized repeat protein (TIGR04076 family)
MPSDDSSGRFELYDLAVIVESIAGHCTCDMSEDDTFYMKSGKISLPDGRSFCMYAIQAAMPLLPAKQRQNHPADWLETDSRVVCPDPACQLTMRIDRIGRRSLHHDEVSPIAWADIDKDRKTVS